MAQRVPRPSSAPPSHTQAPGPPSDLGGKVDEVRKAVIFILKDTDWPEEASNDVQDLIREMEAPLALDNLPKERTEAPEELKTAIDQLLWYASGKRADEIEGRVGEIRYYKERI
ncbi:hypothetical protein FRC00_002956 [Tulasnella sp. 408]|nr:hypothetical protein FRC00_002956 [Tulasnella sp. 408]